MTDRIAIERIIRKTLETCLYSVSDDLLQQVPVEARAHPAYANGFPIWWPNLSFFDKKDQTKPPFYVRFSFHPAPPRIRTVGINPRSDLRGHAMIGCFVPEGDGEDAVDQLMNAVLAAYPLAGLNANRTPRGIFRREGFDTHIESVDPKPAFGSLGRYYRPVHINYSCRRVEP